MQHFTDLFIKRPVWAIVISLIILVLGLKSVSTLPILQYPYTQSAQITVTTNYTGADPGEVAAFITTPLENSIAQANGIDYMTSTSVQGTSTIYANLRLNFDPNAAMTQINTQVNSVLNQLPSSTQQPTISVSTGQTLDAMYIGFYSPVLEANQITDYLTRVVQPRLQAIPGVQQAQILGGRQFAIRAWLDPQKLAAYNVTASDVSSALSNNNFISAVGRTDGDTFIVNLTATTALTSLEEFKRLVIKSENGAIIRLSDVAQVTLGSQNYNSSVRFDGRSAVYVGVLLTPSANLLTVLQQIKQTMPDIQKQLPEGLQTSIVYDSSDYVNSSIHDVIMSLIEAFVIVTIVIYFFLGSVRALVVNFVAIPLSLIGAFFLMLLLGYSINLLTLLSLVLAIGLVVDDAIIIVENVHRHIELGLTPLNAAIQGARELMNPIIAISVVLIAVFLPIGFMGGLTGSLFTEFAFTLVSAITVSAVLALTLSPVMCATYLKPITPTDKKPRVVEAFDRFFARMEEKYVATLSNSLDHLHVTIVFVVIILASLYFLFATCKSELAPQEDQGLLIAQVTTAPNASLAQTEVITKEIYSVFKSFPSLSHAFEINGNNGLNTAITGMVLEPWDDRSETTNQMQPALQAKLNGISGAKVAAFQLPSLPGGGSGLPIQFVITTTSPLTQLNPLIQTIVSQAQASGKFAYIDPDLKIDKEQVTLTIDRSKAAEIGLDMKAIGNVLSAALSQNYINYFNLDGRSYQVIPQMNRDNRLNYQQVLNYYIKTSSGASVPLSTVVSLNSTVQPESINHFQQLNSSTISAVAVPGISMGEALQTFQDIAANVLPQGYSVDYASQSRQFMQESNALLMTFAMAMIAIYLSLAALFNSFRDPWVVLISVPVSICGALIFLNLGIGKADLNIYSEVGLVTLIGLVSKHGILVVQFANELQKAGYSKREATEKASITRFRPIVMTTAAMAFGVIPLIIATGAGAVSRFNLGLVIFTGISIGTIFTMTVVPAMYMLLAKDHSDDKRREQAFTDGADSIVVTPE